MALCAYIATIPANVIPIVSAKLVIAMENCFFSSLTYKLNQLVKDVATFVTISKLLR
jgi:hypothetical protein